MGMRRRDVLKAVGSVAGAATLDLKTRSARADGGGTITRDVCVLGGGSAGTYAALRLRDLGKSVVVIERKSRLGGHAETYVDPTTGVPIDIGVVVLENVDVVRNYTARFGVQLVPLPTGGGGGGETAFVDLRTGRRVQGYAPPAPADFGAALFKYRQVIAQNYPYLDSGFNLPDPVPAELARPFSEFVQRYGLQALFPTLFEYGQGIGNVLADSTLYVLKLFSARVADAILGTGFLIAPGGVAELYDAAEVELGDDVLFEAQATCVDRSHRGRIKVTVDTGCGEQRILCKKLVVAFPPTYASLLPLDLDGTEKSLLGRFRQNHYSTGVVKLQGMPAGVGVQNTGDGTPYNLPPLPGIYGLSPSPVPGLYNVKYGSAFPLPDALVRQAIVADIRRLQSAGTFPVSFEEFEIFSNHAPFQLMVPADDIANGFYKALNSLQGRNGTFYTGAAFQTNDSSLIWSFTESLLPKILA